VHPGHIRYLEAAKEEGDFLVVTVISDQFVHKGPDRPIFNQRLRSETLAAVDCVAISEYDTAGETILALAPDVYVKGRRYSRTNDEPDRQ
jgi:cytidyltransferase-like protein